MLHAYVTCICYMHISGAVTLVPCGYSSTERTVVTHSALRGKATTQLGRPNFRNLCESTVGSTLDSGSLLRNRPYGLIIGIVGDSR